MNVDFLFLLAQQQQAGGGGPQFVGAAPTTQLEGLASVSINVGTSISGIQSGDYVVMVWAADRASLADLTFESGAGLVGEPDTLPNVNFSTSSPGHFIKGWVYDSASPTLSITSTVFGVDRKGVILLAAFRAVQAPMTSQVSIASGLSGDPNPPSLLGVQSGSIVLAVGALDDDAGTFTPPSGYTIAVQGTSGTIGATSNAASAVISYQTATASGAVDPATLTSTGSDEWYAYTIELRAAP